MLVLKEGENRSTRRKPLGTGREPTTNSTHTPSPGVEPEQHWWEPSAVATAPPLLPSSHAINSSQSLLHVNQAHSLHVNYKAEISDH